VLAICLPSLMFAAPLPAYAQSIETSDETLGVAEELLSPGLAYKGFIYAPALTVGGEYNSNVFADKNNPSSDFIYRVRPSIDIKKEYDTLLLNFSGDVNHERFVDNADNNKTEYRTFLTGNYELNSRWSIPMRLRYLKTYRDRGTPQSQGVSEEPLFLTTAIASLGMTRRFNRLSIGLIGSYTNQEFEDGVAQNGNDRIIFSDGNRDIYKGTLSFKYDFLRSSGLKPDYVFFTDLSLASHKYENRAFENGEFTGINQDRVARSFLSGFDVNYKEFVFGRIAAGYTSQVFEVDERENIDSFLVEADMSYKFTDKHLLGFKIEREINADRIIQTNYGLSSAYEIYHNLFLNTDLLYDTYEFTSDTETENREDTDYGANIGLKYFINDNLSAGLNLGYSTRVSSEPDTEFDRYIIGVQLTGKL